MGAPEVLPDLKLTKPDGTKFTRREMEEQIRTLWPKPHTLRIKSSTRYDLPKQYAFDMKEVVLRHWVLDEMVRRGEIIGDQVGVNTQRYDNEDEHRQFTLRLMAFVQNGQALVPKEGEGIDMSNTPPNMNGQGGYAPPPPPGMGPPMGPPGFAPQGPPAGGPPQFNPAPPQQGYQPGLPPGAPGFQAAPPQQQQFQTPGFPPGPPMGMPPQAPPMGVPPQAAPQAAPQSAKKSKKSETQAAPAPGGFVPQGGPAPGGFAPLPQGGFPGVSQPPYGTPPQMQQAPQIQAPVAQQLGVDLSGLTNKIDALTQTVNGQAALIHSLSRQLTITEMGACLILRAIYSKAGAPDLEGFLRELNVQLPQ